MKLPLAAAKPGRVGVLLVLTLLVLYQVRVWSAVV